ncbi:2'-5' RNA ligase family protein, partial [Thauera sp.]|uniref:2'-5' RNA ligase family protein n=1 Tax=Thauera sp. TaxID=1905334 RepID=UPI0026242245
MTDPATLRRRFLAEPHTLRNARGDFSAWHRGRPHYLLWALDVDRAPVRTRVADARHALDGLLLDGYRRQPHVTLALCGFPAQAPSAADEFDAAWLDACVAALRAARIAPFTIEIGTLESFSSAPFLCVQGGGDALDALRACLQPAVGHPQGDYVAHVTVGLYAGEWPTAAVASRFAAFRAGPPLRCEITRISLMGYVAEEIGGALFTLADWQLAAQTLQWHDTCRSGGSHEPYAVCRSGGSRELHSCCRSGGSREPSAAPGGFERLAASAAPTEGGAAGESGGAVGVFGGAAGESGGAVGVLGGAAGALGEAAGALGRAADASGGALGALGGAAGESGGAAGALGGAAGALGGAVGALGGAVGALGGAVGALGGAVGALGGA